MVRHDAVAPGEVACGDLLAVNRRPTRGVRPRTATEVAFMGLGTAAEPFLRAAAAAGTAHLARERAAILDLEAVWGRERLVAALDRATRFRRFKAADLRAILAAGFPVRKTLAEFPVPLASIPPATLAYIASLEWVRAQENLLLVGPPGTGKSHVLIGAGDRAVAQGLRVRYLVAADLVETLYRGLADNTVGRVIDGLLRADLILVDELGFAPLDETGCQLLFRFVAAAYERRSLGVASHWPFEEWGRFLPVPSTATSLLDRLLHHAVIVVTSGDSFRMREARTRGGGNAGPPAPLA